MNLIPIPSENCPYCGVKDSECSLIITEIPTLKSQGIKSREKDFIFEEKGSRSRKAMINEGYIAHKYICNNRRESENS